MLKAKPITKTIIALTLFFLPFANIANGAENFYRFLEENVMGGEPSETETKEKESEIGTENRKKSEILLPEKQKEIRPERGKSKTRWNRYSNEEKAKARAKREENISKWESLSDGEKAELRRKRQKQKAKWDSVSEKEKAKARAKREKSISKSQKLSDEEKEELRKKRQEQKAKWNQLSDEEKARALEQPTSSR